MSKSRVKRKMSLVKRKTSLPAVREWERSDDLLADIRQTLTRFRRGDVDCEQARIEVRGFQCAAAILALQLEHARHTERLKRGNETLPGFKIG